jgi:hypothetical protein
MGRVRPGRALRLIPTHDAVAPPIPAGPAPMLMMSQNRMAARDRLEAHNDYEINRKAEEVRRTRR